MKSGSALPAASRCRTQTTRPRGRPPDPESRQGPGRTNTTLTIASTGAAGDAPPDADSFRATSRLERLASEDPTEHDLARELALSIRTVAHDLRAEPPKRYGYEEWVHFTKLIRFSRLTRVEAEALEEEGGTGRVGLDR